MAGDIRPKTEMRPLIFILLLFVGSGLKAQVIDMYPTNEEDYIKRLNKDFNATKNPAMKETVETFTKHWADGQFAAEIMDNIIKYTNVMVERKMRVSPYFDMYIRVFNGFAERKNPSDNIDSWFETLEQVFANSSTRSHKQFKDFCEFSEHFFATNSLLHSRSKEWEYIGEEYIISFEDGNPKITIPAMDLIGFVRGDTVKIAKTSAVYYPFSSKLVGSGGRVDWSRAGLDSNDVFCELVDYEIELDRNNYSIDSAFFIYIPILSEPVLGKLEDKLVIGNTEDKTTYPRFTSYKNDIKLENIVPSVNYIGGFSVEGSKILAQSTDGKGELRFFTEEGNLAVAARSDLFLIKPSGDITCLEAETILYFDEDSIYHPGMILKYLNEEKKLNLLTEDKGVKGAEFYDSYHKLDINCEQISWKINEPTIEMKMITGAGRTSAFFGSVDLFEEKKYDRAKGFASYQPLSVLKRYCDENDTNVIAASVLAKRLDPNLGVSSIRNLLYQLVEDGFIFYDNSTQQITVKQKTFNYVRNYAGKLDYDVIKIESSTKGVNAYIDLDTNDMYLSGVYQVNLSDSQYVRMFPKDKVMVMKKNRDMALSGTVFGGQVDLIGSNYYFSYDTFDIKMQNIDYMEMWLPKFNDLNIRYAKREELELITTRLESFAGKLQIDLEDNKSGRMRIDPVTEEPIRDTTFPRLISISPSYAYYDRPEIYNAVYERAFFYFKADPFVFPNLDKYKVRDVRFDGTLTSAKIFPDIKETLVVRDEVDYSLGFKHMTGEAGLPAYTGIGNYAGLIDLSNQGLRGKGQVDFQTSRSISNDIIFFPDSMEANVDSFFVDKDTKFPMVRNTNVFALWSPYHDRMIVDQKDKTFEFFDTIATLQGQVTVRSTGLEGKGLMDWDEATLRSNLFKYGPMVIDADTAELKIKSLDETKVAFNLPNVKAHVDFEEREGNFKSNEEDIPTDLPYNQYSTLMFQFDWDMTEKLITFKPPPSREYARFTSTRKEQDGLYFDAKGGTYDLEEYLLIPTGIPFIRVADAKIIPDSGKVVIEAEAKMRTLYNSTILIDTITELHKIYDATTNIMGKNKYKSTGFYDYVNRSNVAQVIKFNDVSVIKDEVYGHVSKGTAFISDSADFWLDPEIEFKGNVELSHNDKYLRFKGLAKLNIKDSVNVKSDWFTINSQANPRIPSLEFIGSTNSGRIPVVAGICRRADSSNLYTSLLNKKVNRRDAEFFITEGVVQYKPETRDFLFGPEDKLLSGEGRGNMLTYNKQTKDVKGEGVFTMGEFGYVDVKGTGEVTKTPKDSTYQFMMTMGFNFFLDPKIVDKIATDMAEFTLEQEDLNTETEYLENSLINFVDISQEDKMLDNFYSQDQFVKPKGMEYKLILTHMRMIWDPYSESLVSIGRGGLSYFGDKQINRECKVFVQIKRKRGGDEIRIYIESDYEDWWYFQYRRNALEVVSSEEEITRMIGDLKADKRMIRDKKNKGKFQMFAPGSKRRKDQFVKFMQTFSGNN